MYQHRDVRAIDTKLKKIFLSICDCFVDNKLSIHFGEGKTKYILFGMKNQLKQDNNVDIRYSSVPHNYISWLRTRRKPIRRTNGFADH